MVIAIATTKYENPCYAGAELRVGLWEASLLRRPAVAGDGLPYGYFRENIKRLDFKLRRSK